MRIYNKRVIVTGAGSGIGKELAKQLIEMGAYVTAIDISKDSLLNLKNEIGNDKLSTYVVDVSKYDSIDKFKEEYIKDHKFVDILINNAGIIQPFVNVQDLNDDVINRVMNVNFFGPLRLCKLFIKDLLKRKEACIVNISSMGGFFPFPGQTVYGASKAALKLFTEGLYAELLDTRIHVMAVFPGAIATNIMINSNVTMNSENKGYKMLSASNAAYQIIKGIEKNKFQLYVGSDSKFMHMLYELNPKKAIKMIKSKIKQ